MTINKIIEKLKEESGKQMKKGKEGNGTYNILKSWYEKMRECKRCDDFESCYHKIQGLLYGLYGAYFITEQELDETLDELQKTYRNKIYEHHF